METSKWSLPAADQEILDATAGIYFEGDTNGVNTEIGSEYGPLRNFSSWRVSLWAHKENLDRIPRTSKQENIELAKTIEAGVLAQEKLDTEDFAMATPQEYAELSVRGMLAQQRLIEGNLRLAVSFVKEYSWAPGTRDLEESDLIQMASIGIMKTVQQWDYRRGAFSTYAQHHMKNEVGRGIINEGAMIRKPDDIAHKVRQMKSTITNCWSELGREPSDEELAVRLDTTPMQIADLKQWSQPVLRLGKQVNIADTSAELGDFIEDIHAVQPTEAYDEIELRAVMASALDTLSEREAGTLEMLYGLKTGERATFHEVGVAYGVTRERIRQIHGHALSKMRSPKRTQMFRVFLDD